MRHSSIRALVFDIGRVIIRVDIERAKAGLVVDSKVSPAEVWQAIETDPKWHDWQEGRIAPREWHQHLANRMGLSLSFEEFCEAWNGALDPVPQLPDSLFADLSSHYKLAVLSNTDSIHVAHMEANFSFLRAFPVRIYSCAVAARKPSPKIYRHALEGCGVEPTEALFIDDMEPFVAAARQLGMHGLHFASPEQLVSDFRSSGIL